MVLPGYIDILLIYVHLYANFVVHLLLLFDTLGTRIFLSSQPLPMLLFHC